MYLEGHPHPHKGVASVEALHATNHVKRLVKEGLRLWPLVLCRTRATRSFVTLSWGVMEPHIIKYEYLCPAAQTTYRMLRTIFERLGTPEPILMAKVLAHMVEYDQAYRFRIQDLCSETTAQKLCDAPIREIRRLLALNRQRDYAEVSAKMALVAHVLTVALLLPRVRNAFRHAVASCSFKGLQFDEADTYWARRKSDYNYFGNTR